MAQSQAPAGPRLHNPAGIAEALALRHSYGNTRPGRSRRRSARIAVLSSRPMPTRHQLGVSTTTGAGRQSANAIKSPRSKRTTAPYTTTPATGSTSAGCSPAYTTTGHRPLGDHPFSTPSTPNRNQRVPSEAMHKPATSGGDAQNEALNPDKIASPAILNDSTFERMPRGLQHSIWAQGQGVFPIMSNGTSAVARVERYSRRSTIPITEPQAEPKIEAAVRPIDRSTTDAVRGAAPGFITGSGFSIETNPVQANAKQSPLRTPVDSVTDKQGMSDILTSLAAMEAEQAALRTRMTSLIQRLTESVQLSLDHEEQDRVFNVTAVVSSTEKQGELEVAGSMTVAEVVDKVAKLANINWLNRMSFKGKIMDPSATMTDIGLCPQDTIVFSV